MKKHVMHEEDVELHKLKGRTYRLIVGSRQLPCRSMNGGVSYFPPGAHAPGHVHKREEEVIYCLEGKGEIVIDSNPEPIRPGCFMAVSPGVLHSINNTGDRTIKLLFMFSPPCRIGRYADVPSR